MKLAGKQQINAGVISTAGFEQTTKQMLEFAAGDSIDELKGAAAMTMLGQFDVNQGAKLDETEKNVSSAVDLLMKATFMGRVPVKQRPPPRKPRVPPKKLEETEQSKTSEVPVEEETEGDILAEFAEE
jgi:hypothetical protein